MSEEYGMFLKKLGMSDLDIQIQTNTNVIIDTTRGQTRFKIDKSLISGAGLGVFTKIPFKKGDELGVVARGRLKKMMGRFTNHSSIPNIEFRFKGDVVRAFSLRYIHPGEELLVNYFNNLKAMRGE